MSEIRNIPDVKDASGIFKFDAGKKAILVPITAVEGLEKAWTDYARETGTAILPYNRCEPSIDDWEELVKTVHHAFEYGFHCNDMTHGEVEDDISFALDKFAKENGLPVHDWDTDYEEQYGETQAD